MVADLFTVLENKLEAVLKQFDNLKQANTELHKALAEKTKALQDAEAALHKVTQEREVIRQRVDKILNRLKSLDLGE